MFAYLLVALGSDNTSFPDSPTIYPGNCFLNRIAPEKMAEYVDGRAVINTSASSVSSATAHVNGEGEASATGHWGEHTEAESVNINGAYQEFEE